jgi:hypothetical protein
MGLSSLGSASRSNQGSRRFRPRIPRLSEADAREITSNLSNSFITMDMAGMLRPKTVEGVTANLAAYLINNQPTPDNPMAPAHRGALGSLGSSGTSSSPGRRNLHITASVLDIAHHQRMLATILCRVKLTRLATDALRVLALTVMILKKLNTTTVNSVVLIS